MTDCATCWEAKRNQLFQQTTSWDFSSAPPRWRPQLLSSILPHAFAPLSSPSCRVTHLSTIDSDRLRSVLCSNPFRSSELPVDPLLYLFGLMHQPIRISQGPPTLLDVSAIKRRFSSWSQIDLTFSQDLVPILSQFHHSGCHTTIMGALPDIFIYSHGSQVFVHCSAAAWPCLLTSRHLC